MAGAAVIGKVDAAAQRGVQKQLAALRLKALPIDRNFVAARHGPIPKIFDFPKFGNCEHIALGPHFGTTRKRCFLNLKHATSLLCGRTLIFAGGWRPTTRY